MSLPGKGTQNSCREREKTSRKREEGKRKTSKESWETCRKGWKEEEIKNDLNFLLFKQIFIFFFFLTTNKLSNAQAIVGNFLP